MHNPRLNQTWFRCLILVLLILGIFFRFVNLDKKVYWHDEAYTSLRISGYTTAEVYEQVFNGEVISIEDLQKYQRPNPEKSLIDTVKALAIDDAQHPPLYYIMVRLWVQWFGNSVAVTRSLSALISLLVFPCVYWLCWELFESTLVGWMAIALIAVSPFHVLYAQEAREYSLWTVTILLSSAMLLQAVRTTTNSKNLNHSLRSWAIYTTTLAISFYTFPLSCFVAMGHGIYLAIAERFRLTKAVIAYLLALAIAFLGFAPWLAIAIVTWSRTGANWTAVPIPLLVWLKGWGLHINHAFILTLEDFVRDFGFDNLLTYLTLPFFLILVIYSIYYLCRYTPQKVWLFVLTLMLTSTLILVLPDLLLGGQRSTSSRYIIPFYLGIQLSISYLLATQIASASLTKRKFAQIIITVLLSSGVISCAILSQAETAWNKVVSYNNHQVARIINQEDNPLLISSNFGINFANNLALGYLLESKVKLQLFNDYAQNNFEKIIINPQNFSGVFILNTSEEFRLKIEKKYQITLDLIYNDAHLLLWKFKPEINNGFLSG